MHRRGVSTNARGATRKQAMREVIGRVLVTLCNEMVCDGEEG